MADQPLCGALITSRRSFLALAWTLTTLLSFFSFGVSVFLGTKITSQYNSMQTADYAEWYQSEYNYNYDCRRHLSSNDNDNNNDNSGDENDHDGDGEADEDKDGKGCHSNDNAELDEDFFESLATKNSRGLVFAGVYTTVLGIALSLYGSTVVVGFMSAKGEYIPPCFSFRNMSIIEEEEMNDEDSTTGPRKHWGEKIHRGIFLGSVVIFGAMMILCAVIFGELQVYDNYNNYDDQKHNNLFSYRIEKISSVFAITCIVLAFVYILFAVIYTTCGGMSDDNDAQLDSSAKQQGWDQRRQYEMSSQNGRGRQQRSRGRRSMPNSRDKQEPLVGAGRRPGGITDNEGFITDMVSHSSGSSLGSNRWERGQFELS